jgi:putative ABC transport system permease protein
MRRFAWRNLRTRPLRTALALVGLSIPILGVLGLFGLSQGLRNMVGDTLSQVQGLMLVRENTPSPIISKMPAALIEKIRQVPGVRVVAPELWEIAFNVEGTGFMIKNALSSKKGLMGAAFDQPVIQGQDIGTHARLKSAVFPHALKDGRFLTPEDKGKPHIVISRKIARDHPGPDGKPRKVNDTLQIGSKPFRIVGIYETGSMLLDVVIVMDIGTARKLLGTPEEQVSCFYVETDDPTRNDDVAMAIEKVVPNVDARTMTEFSANFGALMGSVDTFLMMTVSLALLVGVVGIINTMLMSTSERFIEFGVLRTNGWSKGNVLALVTLESAYLGLLSGLIGCVLAAAGATVANQFIGGGLQLRLPPWLFALGIALSLVTGTLGGLYPAWRAARLVPMDAIRIGSH